MRRVISFLLCFAMIFSMLPVGALASETQPEETVAVTEPVEESTAAAEALPETEPETEVMASGEEEEPETVHSGVLMPGDGSADNDVLLEGWLYQQFYGKVSTFGVAASRQLNSYGKVLYDGLKKCAAAVASGEETSTVFEVVVEKAGSKDINDFQLSQVIDALLHDCPYELYWYDKTSGTSYGWSNYGDGTIYSITLRMPVVEDLQGSGYDINEPVADVSLAVEAAQAVQTAHAIAEKYAGRSTYEKLVAFRDEICDLTSYNDEAAESMDFSADADPWQLLWVFDGDSSTQVVCEGYSKAFQYLCDLDGTIDCYTVTGNMTFTGGGGGHMWNIVTLNGANYLADVTNSDSGTAGYDGSLFLNGCTGSVANGYTFSTAGGSIKFTYSSEMLELWGTDGILVLSTTAYDPDDAPAETEPEETQPEETEPEVTEPAPVVSGTYGSNVSWSYDPNTTTLTISGTGVMKDKSGDVPWSDYQLYATKLVIEDGITAIGKAVFELHTALESVSIPDSVTAIGDEAFQADSSMRELKLSENLQTIGSNAFESCVLLSSVTLPEYVSTVGSYAFYRCINLTEIRFPSGITTIGDYAMGGCEALKTVTFVGMPPNIGANSFADVVATVNYPANAGWMDVNLQNYGGALTWVKEVVTSGPCGNFAYWNYDADTRTLTVSGTGAMYDQENEAPWADYQQEMTKIVIEDGITSIGSSCFAQHNFVDTVIIADSVTAIGDNAFNNALLLNTLTLGSGVQTIGSSAFANSEMLFGVALPQSLTTLGSSAFYSCGSLQEITLPAGVVSIGDQAFADCTNLTTVTFEGLPADIGAAAFYGVTATVNYPANAGWGADMTQDYGGNLTWEAYGDVPEETEPAETGPVDTEAVTYTLYFNNPLTGTVLAVAAKDGGTPEYVPTAETVAGYDFMGWFSGENGTGIQILAGDTWTSDMPTTWYAYYTESQDDTLCTLSVYYQPYYENGSVASTRILYQKDFSLGDDIYSWLTSETGVATIQGCLGDDYTWKEPGIYYDYTCSTLLTELIADGNESVCIRVAAPAAETLDQAQFLAELAEAAANNEDYYLTRSVTVSGELNIDQNIWLFVEDGGSITVPAGCSLTIGENTHIVVMNGGSFTVFGTLNAIENLSLQITSGALAIGDNAVINAPDQSINVTLNSATVSMPASAKSKVYAFAYPSTEAELKDIVNQAADYGFVNAGVEQSMTIDWDLTIPDNLQLGLCSGSGIGVVTLTVASGYTLTNNGWLAIDADTLLYIEAGAALINNQSLEYWEDCYRNDGTEVNNGSIHENRIVNTVPELNEALAEAAAASGDDNFPTVYLNQNLTMVSGDAVSIPANVTLIVNALLTMESGTSLTIQQGGCLMTGLYDSDVLAVQSGAEFHNYGQLYLENGRSAFAGGTYFQYDGGMADLYPNASVTGIADSLIDCNLYFMDEASFAQVLAAAQTGSYGTYTLMTEGGCGIVAISGTYEIPANTMIDLYNGSGLELLSGADVTNNGEIRLFYGSMLIIAQDALLTNNNLIDNYGGTIDGTVTGNQPNGGSGGSGGTTSGITDQASLEDALAEDRGISIDSTIVLNSDLTMDASSLVMVESNGALVVPDGVTLTVSSRVMLLGGSILVENGGTLVVTDTGRIENDSGTITNNGTVTIDPAGAGIWEYPVNGATSSGIARSEMKGIVYVDSTAAFLAGLDATAGYGDVALVATCEFSLTQSMTIPENTTLELIWFDFPVSVTVSDGATLTNNGTILVLVDTELIVEQGSRLVNNGYMEVQGTYINNGTHAGNAPVQPDDGSGVQTGICGENLTWRFDATTGTLTISGTGDMDCYGDSVVVDPGMKPWRHLTWQITHVVVEEGVTGVEGYAFSDYPNLQTVILPETLIRIGERAFCWNSAMEKITIPAAVQTIGREAFRGCSALAEVTFAGGAPVIGLGAFRSVTATVYYPSADRSWGGGLGQYGGSLTWIPYGPNSGSCGDNAVWSFNEADGTLTISGTGEMEDYYDLMDADETLSPWRHLKDEILHLVIEEGIINVSEYAFINYPNLETVILPESLTAIANNAFDSLLKLKEITIPANVDSIGNAAFYGCTALEKITFTGDVPSFFSEYAFTDVTATVCYPGANATWTGDKLANYGGSLTWVPVYDLDQSALDNLIDNAPQNGDGNPMVSEDITVAADTVLFREGKQVIFSGDITVPAGVTLIIRSDVLLTGKLHVAEGGAVVLENPDQSGESWVMLVDCGGAEIDGSLTIGERCSFIVNDGAESVFGETSVVDNYGSFCAEWNGIIRSGGIINNYNFVTVLNRVTVGGELNNFGYINVEASGAGQLTIDGLLINHGEMAINAGSSVYVNGSLYNNSIIHHFKSDDETVTGYFVVDGTLVNEQSGQMYLRDWVVVRNVVENYGFLYTSSMFHVESGVVKNLNRSVDKRGYLITENGSEFIVQGKLENSGDIEHFGYMEMDGGTADIGGTFYNHGMVGLGHFYGGTMNLTGTLNNEGEIWVNHSVVDGQLLDGILNIDGELVNNGMLGISGEANLNGALTNNGTVSVAGETAVLAAAEGAVLIRDGAVELGTYGRVENISDSDVVLRASVNNVEELIWALTQAAEHAYLREFIMVESSFAFEGVTVDEDTVQTELVIPESVRLEIMPEFGELVFAPGTSLINEGFIGIHCGAALVIAENASLENNGTIHAYDGWIIVEGQQTGEGIVEVPEEVTVTTEAELQAAVTMGIPTIILQGASGYAVRTVSELILTKDLTIPAGIQLVMLGVNLVVPENVTLAVEGSVVVTDGSNVTVNGALKNNAVGEIGLQLVSGSLTFGETGSYDFVPGAETAVGNDFVISNNSDKETIPSDEMINLRWVVDFAYLQTLLTEAENGQPYRIQINESFPIEENVTIPANVELVICEGMTLSVPANIRLYNAGTITIQNWAELYINGHYSYVELDGVLNIAEQGRFITEFPAAESITLCADGKPDSILLQPGEEAAITTGILPGEASAQILLWDVIQENDVVSLDEETMTLTALAEGTAVLRATATDGSGVTAELAVTVSGYGIEITGDSYELMGGKSIQLEAKFLPDNLSGTGVVWSLAEGSEAFVTLKAKGNTATVTAADVSEVQTITVVAESEDGEAAPAEYRLTLIPKARSITIYNNDLVNGWEGVLRDETYSLVGEKEDGFDLILRAEASPDGASSEVTWNSTNTKVAYFVSDAAWNAQGYVKLRFTATPGTTKITATAADGSKTAKTVSISTVKPVSVAAKGETELTLVAGKTATLKLVDLNTGKEIKPANIQWHASEAQDAMGNWGEPSTVIDAKGKLNTKNVTAYEKLEVYGTVYVEDLYMGDVQYTIEVYPKTTAVELYQGNELVSGKTLPLDIETGSLKLSALQLPLDALSDVDWKSSKDSIATVEDGLVTFAGKTGTVTITATAADGSNKKATVKVEVGVMTTEILASAPAATLVSGKSMTLTHTTVPAAPTKSGVTWSIVEGSEFAKISGSKLTAKTVYAPQTVVLVATSKDAAHVVSEPVTVTILPKTTETLNLMIGEELVTGTTRNAAKGETFELSAWMFFSDLAKDEKLTNVTWASKKPAVATVSTAKDEKAVTTTVTVVGSGSATITATGKNSDGKTVTATVTIKSGILSEGVKVTSDVFTVGSGKSITLKAETIPAKPTTRGVVWSLAEGDEAYAKISSSGKLTAAKGLNSVQEVTVLVQAKDGNSPTVEIPVTVTPLATGVELIHINSKVNGQTIPWSVDEELKLSARVYPFSGYGANSDRNANQTVTWKSSNPKILAIDARTGKVSFGTKTGTVTITATANDGSGKKATVKVKTIVPIRELEIRDGIIAGGKTLKLSTLITKINADATNKKLQYHIGGSDGADFFTLTASGELKTQKVTAPKTVEIYAFDEFGYVFEDFVVTITPATTNINLEVLVDGKFTNVNGKTLELEAGHLLTVQANSDPDGAYGNYTWKITNPGYACLRDEVGDEELSAFEGCYALVDGLTPGKTVTLTATAMDGSGKKATVKIQVVEPSAPQ